MGAEICFFADIFSILYDFGLIMVNSDIGAIQWQFKQETATHRKRKRKISPRRREVLVVVAQHRAIRVLTVRSIQAVEI